MGMYKSSIFSNQGMDNYYLGLNAVKVLDH